MIVTYLMSHHHGGLSAVVILQQSLLEATLAVRAPVGLLGVIGLEHVSPLHIHGDDEVRSRIRIWLTRFPELDMARHFGLVDVRRSDKQS